MHKLLTIFSIEQKLIECYNILREFGRGEMSERPKVADSKSAVHESAPGVQIPLSPPFIYKCLKTIKSIIYTMMYNLPEGRFFAFYC